MYLAKILATGGIAILLSGCASLRGAPEPVISVQDALVTKNQYAIPAVFTTYNGFETEGRRAAFRNEVVYAYLQAIDARYYEFRTLLSSESREAALGLEMSALGIAGLGTIVENSAEELAALSGVIIGTQASVDKNLYFDQSVPALVAAMDAERLKVRLGLNEKLSKDAANYPLSAAFTDLMEYQAAGTIDRAVSIITDEAVKRRVEAEERYDDNVRFACTPEEVRALTEGQTTKMGDFNFAIYEAALAEEENNPGTVVARNRLEALARAYGIRIPDEIEKVRTVAEIEAVDGLINRAMLEGFCTTGDVLAQIEKLKADPQFADFVSNLN